MWLSILKMAARRAVGAGADVDHAGILARARITQGACGRQLLQVDARALVGAMLGPHHREDAELGQVRLAPERVQDALIFLGAEAVLGDDLGRDPVRHGSGL